jgi:hypothetical protein
VKDQCSNCKFIHESVCRRFPPTVTLMDVPPTNSYGEPIGHAFYQTQVWPTVEPTDWCGEYRGWPE